MKTKKVVVKTEKVMIMYGGQRLSLQAVENERQRSRGYARNHVITATVPAKIKTLLQKEADTQGLNMSAMIGQALVMYLQDCGTKIEA